MAGELYGQAAELVDGMKAVLRYHLLCGRRALVAGPMDLAHDDHYWITCMSSILIGIDPP